MTHNSNIKYDVTNIDNIININDIININIQYPIDVSTNEFIKEYTLMVSYIINKCKSFDNIQLIKINQDFTITEQYNMWYIYPIIKIVKEFECLNSPIDITLLFDGKTHQTNQISYYLNNQSIMRIIKSQPMVYMFKFLNKLEIKYIE